MPPAADKQLKELTEAVAALTERIRGLEEKVAALGPRLRSAESVQASGVRPNIAFDELTQQLSKSVGLVNEGVKKEGAGVVIDRLEVELKTGVVLPEGKGPSLLGMKLSPPLAHELKPESLSTLRFTLRPVTEMKFSG